MEFIVTNSAIPGDRPCVKAREVKTPRVESFKGSWEAYDESHSDTWHSRGDNHREGGEDEQFTIFRDMEMRRVWLVDVKTPGDLFDIMTEVGSNDLVITREHHMHTSWPTIELHHDWDNC